MMIFCVLRRVDFEARDFFLQPADRLSKLRGGLVELAERDQRLVDAVGEMDDGFPDLVGTLRLHPHALSDLIKALGEALHGRNDRDKLFAHVGDLADAVTDLIAELVHFHHARRDARLHLLDHALDIERRDGGLIGEAADFAGNDEKTEAVFARFFGFDRRVDRE